jgi:hypothetical protein
MSVAVISIWLKKKNESNQESLPSLTIITMYKSFIKFPTR